MKQRWIIGLFFLFLIMLAGGLKAEATENWEFSWMIKNADFENINIADYGRNAGQPNVWYVNQDGVEAWATSNPSGNIEVWQNGNGENVPAFSGTNFIELNSDGPGPVYQDIKTVPGSTLKWSFAHRGRSGTDIAELLIGAPDNPLPIMEAEDGMTWNTYSGTYVVPAGQTITRLTFNPVATSHGNLTIGNFLDDINLYIDVTGAQLGDYVWYDTNGDGVQNNGEPPAPNVQVELYTKNNVLVKTATTNDIGSYLFTGLLAGEYHVKFINPDPSRYTFTKQKIGDEKTDSDPDKNGDATANLTSIRDSNTTIDAGLTTTGSIIIHKVDQNKKLANAKFTVQDSNGTTIASGTTNEDGSVQIDGLTPGNYFIQETAAPTGYELEQTRTPFTITYGQTAPVELTVTNQLKTGTLIIHKINTKNQDLGNAIFDVFDKSNQAIAKIVTNTSGIATLNDLLPGSYYVKEREAPDGYQLKSDNIPFTIPFNPITPVTLTIQNTAIPANNPATPAEQPKHQSETPVVTPTITPVTAVQNATAAEKLPETGDREADLAQLIGLVLLATGILLRRT
ncbi:SpaA isopeptide-forming pilin-related protein [Listeria riparia]|uniref:Cell wall surface anchor family protein n=1 Tax=Listeria riparia FSL S10-1204 TaxID=1265816 RepID=W7D4P4_9LIST|nr:SpaA isopeptide-forming pilin-related protein [Listeria riparia]EUJ43935.1 cell wall surface anchor family protein [Listeria riparia FSL S10-1204]